MGLCGLDMPGFVSDSNSNSANWIWAWLRHVAGPGTSAEAEYSNRIFKPESDLKVVTYVEHQIETDVGFCCAGCSDRPGSNSNRGTCRCNSRRAGQCCGSHNGCDGSGGSARKSRPGAQSLG